MSVSSRAEEVGRKSRQREGEHRRQTRNVGRAEEETLPGEFQMKRQGSGRRRVWEVRIEDENLPYSDRLIRSNRQINEPLSPLQWLIPSSPPPPPSLHPYQPPSSLISTGHPSTRRLHPHAHMLLFFAHYLQVNKMKQHHTWHM